MSAKVKSYTHKNTMAKYLKDKDILSWLPKSNTFHTYSIEQVFEKNPDYAMWIVKNCWAYRFSEGIRGKINKYRKAQTKNGHKKFTQHGKEKTYLERNQK